jgi:hypothetical protein
MSTTQMGGATFYIMLALMLVLFAWKFLSKKK